MAQISQSKYVSHQNKIQNVQIESYGNNSGREECRICLSEVKKFNKLIEEDNFELEDELINEQFKYEEVCENILFENLKNISTETEEENEEKEKNIDLLKIMIRSLKPVELQILQTEKIMISESLLECRICLEEMEEEELLFICKCKGNSGAIHKECLIEWIKKSRKFYRHRLQYYYNCEICKEQIGLESESKIKCIDKIDEEDSLCTLGMVVVLLVAVVVVGISLFALLKEFQTQFAISGIVIGILTIVIDLVVYVLYSFITIAVNITGLKQKQETKLNRKLKNRIKNNQIAQENQFERHNEKNHSSETMNQNELSIANLNELFAD